MDALGINLSGLITQLVSFVVLFAVLSRLLYKPVLGALDRRSARIRESLEAAEKAREESAHSQEEMQQQLEAARAEGQQLISQARELADRFRGEELAKAERRSKLKGPGLKPTSRGSVTPPLKGCGGSLRD